MEGVGERWLLGRVSPSGPDGVNGMETREFDDEVDVGVIVIVGAAGHVDDDVRHADVLGVGAVRGGMMDGWMNVWERRERERERERVGGVCVCGERGNDVSMRRGSRMRIYTLQKGNKRRGGGVQ